VLFKVRDALPRTEVRKIYNTLNDINLMNESSATDARIQQFAQLARNYQLLPSKQFSALLPYRASITDLRSKGASFAAIASMLKDIQVKVSSDTLRRFFHEIIEEKSKGQSVRRGGKAQAKPTPASTTAPSISSAESDQSLLSPTQKPFVPPAPATDVPRSRGPRIADPNKF